MSEPTVFCIMLTRDRPELAMKAIQCFRKQTYQNKKLLIWDSGDELIINSPHWDGVKAEKDDALICHVHILATGETIGALRNQAVALSVSFPVICHWDDDDWSHPNRIAEQVELLQASGADVVGYNEMLFWQRYGCRHYEECPHEDGEVWLYKGPTAMQTLGTSLCYWRKTWEKKPFNPTMPRNRDASGEDYEFLRGCEVAAVSSVRDPGALYPLKPNVPHGYDPRMIARIHGSNSSNYDQFDTWQEMKRVPGWDQKVRELLG